MPSCGPAASTIAYRIRQQCRTKPGGDMADEPDMNVAPVVTGFSPDGSADVTGGETVVITGSSFLGRTSVGFGPYPAYFTAVSDTEIQATAPAYDPAVTSTPASAPVTVFKDSLGNDGANLAEWTWAGQTRQQLQD